MVLGKATLCKLENWKEASDNDRSSRPEVFCRKGVFENLQENTCARVSFLIKSLFFCEFCEIFKNSYFCRTPLVAVFVVTKLLERR